MPSTKHTLDQELQDRIALLEQEAARGKTAEALAETVLDSLSAHIAILDSQGLILKTNQAWKEFAQANELQIRPEELQVNYLEICDQAKGESAEHAQEVAQGIRRVIAGDIQEFLLDYPCHSPQHKRWFYMRARRLQGPGPLRVVVSHENITPLKSAEEELKRKEQELQESNAALRALLRQRDQDREELEANILENVKNQVLPWLRDLEQTRLDQIQQSLVQGLEKSLLDLASPFVRSLSRHYASLTPQELKIASLIQQGQSSKEIAHILQCSEHAVQFHRKNLRRKLGLKSSSTSLYTYLQSLDQR
ncbi:MAG: LuxR C-terminal-related transcriptional regulator [Thermodesulfobacteriota bacterium]